MVESDVEAGFSVPKSCCSAVLAKGKRRLAKGGRRGRVARKEGDRPLARPIFCPTPGPLGRWERPGVRGRPVSVGVCRGAGQAPRHSVRSPSPRPLH